MLDIVAASSFSVLTWIIISSFIGATLSIVLAGLFALNLRTHWVPMLVSYAIGAMLGAVFLEILPHAFEEAESVHMVSTTLLLGLLLFFILEKLVIWRHCHGDHCEVHAPHSEDDCPDGDENKAHRHHAHSHSHEHDYGRSGLMMMIGDTFHNFIDGVLIAAAFMTDIKLGLVTATAIIAHEIPQEVGDFLILLHSGYSKQKAFLFNLVSSVATLVGGLSAYYALQTLQSWIPVILAMAAASLLYVAVADLIPGLHKRTEMKATLQQVSLISLGILTIGLIHFFLE